MKQEPNKFLTSDPDFCLGCRGCELACATGNASKYANEEGKTKRAVLPNIIVSQSLDKKIPNYCRHCKDAFCLMLCPTKAIIKEKDIIIIQDEKCTGCGICEQGCPYGVITITPHQGTTNTKKIANKCDLCRDRRTKDNETLCTAACPTKALRLV